MQMYLCACTAPAFSGERDASEVQLTNNETLRDTKICTHAIRRTSSGLLHPPFGERSALQTK